MSRNLAVVFVIAACLMGASRGEAVPQPDPNAGYEADLRAVDESSRRAAAVDPMAVTVLQWFEMIEQSLVPLAEAMPAEKYDFKPTRGEFRDARTFGEQLKHVACGNFGFFNEIEKKPPPERCDTGGPSPAKTKDQIVAYLKESFDYAKRVLATMTAANALDSAGGPYGGQSTRLGLTTLAVWHASDHYGQLVIYLRMNGLVPPASWTGGGK